MGSLVLAGDTSGSVTVAVPAVAGTNTVTIPAATGTVMLSVSGMVANFAMNTAPSGWLAADGTAVSRTTYASLFSAIGTTFGVGDGSTTFNLPNLGGQFTRNWISGQTTDSGRVFGSSQTDAFQGHKHASDGVNYMTDQPTGSGSSSGGGARFQQVGIGNPTTDGTNGVPRTATETRPTNIALLACIKT
jgi:phage-related tail fiber protein